MLMKHLTMFLVTLGVALMALGVGCSPKHKPEAALLRQAFAEASGEVRAHVDAALAALNAQQFEQAVDALANLEEVELSDAQRDAVADVLVDIQSSLQRQDGSPELLERTQNLMMSFM
jgi:cytochrome c-type biogenesis protein CcmH/NrfG